MVSSADNRTHLLLLLSTFVIAVCGLVYELLAGTISSYLLGNSIYQFSIVIGLFVASMGIGSWLSRFIDRRLEDFFIAVQIAVGFIGGFSAVVLFFAFANLDNYTVFLVLISVVLGTLIGIEIPLVLRIIKSYSGLKLSVSNVFTADYIGALGASLLFPLVLVPQLGLLRTGLLFGLLNVLVAAIALYTFGGRLVNKVGMIIATLLVTAALGVGFVTAERLSSYFENRFYSGEIIYAQTTPYQRIVISRDQDVISMFINGALQFNTLDEYRYHEALVHPVMNLSRHHENVLVLGGGDGMAVREVLKYPKVKSVTLVDIDPAITRIFSNNELLKTVNDNALNDKRVNVLNRDAWKFIEAGKQLFDVIIVDLPDPNDIGLSKLYSRAFYADLVRRLSADGVIVTQATSPLYTREAFSCINHTLQAVPSPIELEGHLYTQPYHVYIPTFGEWGFVLASPRPVRWDGLEIDVQTRYLDEEALMTLTRFPRDMAELETGINTLQEHALAYYYERGWSRWYR